MNKWNDALSELYSAIDSMEQIKESNDSIDIVKSESNLKALRRLQFSMKEYINNILNL